MVHVDHCQVVPISGVGAVQEKFILNGDGFVICRYSSLQGIRCVHPVQGDAAVHVGPCQIIPVFRIVNREFIQNGDGFVVCM